MILENEISKDKLLLKLMKRQEFLVRKLQESMSDGKKIFVHLIDYDYDIQTLSKIYVRLKKYGVKKLLFLARQDAVHKVGTFTEIDDGCIVAYLKSIHPMPTVIEDWDNILIKAANRFG